MNGNVSENTFMFPAASAHLTSTLSLSVAHWCLVLGVVQAPQPLTVSPGTFQRPQEAGGPARRPQHFAAALPFSCLGQERRDPQVLPFPQRFPLNRQLACEPVPQIPCALSFPHTAVRHLPQRDTASPGHLGVPGPALRPPLTGRLEQWL